MEDLVLWIAGLLLLAAALAPTLIAFQRRHHYRWVILAMNVVLGLSGIGYLAALVWAVWPRRTSVADVLLNDPISNSTADNRVIHSRYGSNLQAASEAKEGSVIYLFIRNQQLGPYTGEEVRMMLQQAQIPKDALGWSATSGDWVPVVAVPEVAALFAVPHRS